MNKFFLLIFSLFSLFLTSSCSTYKSSWDCPKASGIGCSSLEYADEIARQQMILNKAKREKRKILINRDFLGKTKIEEIEIQ